LQKKDAEKDAALEALQKKNDAALQEKDAVVAALKKQIEELKT